MMMIGHPGMMIIVPPPRQYRSAVMLTVVVQTVTTITVVPEISTALTTGSNTLKAWVVSSAPRL